LTDHCASCGTGALLRGGVGDPGGALPPLPRANQAAHARGLRAGGREGSAVSTQEEEAEQRRWGRGGLGSGGAAHATHRKCGVVSGVVSGVVWSMARAVGSWRGVW